MAYFRNTAVNLLNLHYGLHAVAMAGGGAFFLVYLLKAGLSAPVVLASMALILIGRFLIRPFIIGCAVRWGIRRIVMAGTLLNAMFFTVLAVIHDPLQLLAPMIAISALADTLYWTTFHAYFAALGDDHHRGHQLGAREAIAAIAGVMSPLVTGWLLVRFGPAAAFGATAAIAASASVPFLWTPDMPVLKSAPGAIRAARHGMLLFAADGWIQTGFAFVWQLTLFISLGESYLKFGGALALAALAGAIGGLLLGRHIDAGHGRKAVLWACGTMLGITVLRLFAVHDAALAVIANALGALGLCLYTPTLLTAVYNQSKRAPCTLRFHVATEGAWDVGGGSGLLTAALLTALGVPLWMSMVISLIGLAIMFVALRRYFGKAMSVGPKPLSFSP